MCLEPFFYLIVVGGEYRMQKGSEIFSVILDVYGSR
jgi:hypothetical protein